MTRITKGLRCKLWVKCAAHVTDMENVIVRKTNYSSLFEKFYGKVPHFTSNIRIFGKMVIVCVYDNQIKSK